MLNDVKSFFIRNKVDLYYVLFLVALLLIIGIPKLLSQYSIGIGNWDTYLYLENGRTFSKMGWGDVPSIAPVLPMMLSKLFLIAGHPYQEAIFNVDVVSYIVGVITLYLILRFKFDRNTSFTGSIIYATFTLLYSWVAIGGNDIIGVTGTLLTVYFVLVAHNYDTRFYYIALPVAAYAFLTRYTAGVMLFALIFYLIINKISLREIRDIIIGAVLGVISISWFLNQFNKTLGTPFPFLGQFSGTVSNTQVLDSGYLPDTWYYIMHIPNYLNSIIPAKSTFNAVVNPMGNIPTLLSYVFIFLMIAGFILIFYNIYKCSENNTNRKFFTAANIILLLCGVVAGLICVFTLIHVSYIVTNILFLLVMSIIWLLLRDYDIKCLDYDLLMISLFVVYLVFQSILSTKNDRYFITVLPFIAYFISNAISYIYKFLDRKIILKRNIKISTIATVIVAVLLVGNSLAFVDDMPHNNHYRDVEDSCEWLINYYPDYNNSTIIYSDNWPAVTWYMNIYGQRGVPDTSSNESALLFSTVILSQNSTHEGALFYIDTNSVEKIDYPGLTMIKRIGDVAIYENSYKLGSKDKNVQSDEYIEYINNTLEDYNRTLGDYNETG